MTVSTSAPARASDAGTAPAAEIAAISLEQAIVDFEIANARVMDLTQRLIEATAQVGEWRSRALHAEAHGAELERRLEAYGRSRALRLTGAARSLVRSLRH